MCSEQLRAVQSATLALIMCCCPHVLAHHEWSKQTWTARTHTCRALPHNRINHFAEKHVEWSVRLATGYGWLTSMGVVALVPLDVWATLAKQPVQAVGTLWDVTYWWVQP